MQKTNLSTSMTPQSIQAAQMVYAQQNAQKQPPSSKAGLSKLGSMSQTPSQAREKDLTKS